MILVGDVEDVLRTHPDIRDVAVVGYGVGNISACAVVVARGPLTLDDVRAFLNALHMTEFYQPTRLEVIDELPRNAAGKVDKALLRNRLRGIDE
jgi:cyclohexanecarboxylate-CoA ligase